MVATLRISGDALVPEAITSLLGSDPTSSHVGKCGQWSISNPSTSTDLNGQVAQLLARLTDDLTVWRGLGDRFDIELRCACSVGESNDEIEIDLATLRKLAQRGIRVCLGISAPSPGR